MTDGELAEMLEWQARCRDLETSNERTREERDSLIATIAALRTREDALVARLDELERINIRQETIINRLNIHLKQGMEL
jgi:hypothetical protein